MNQNNTVSIQINQDKLLANLEYSFSNATTVLGELMQNSRRAGASSVLLYMAEDSKNLSIIDNGTGIENFQNLLSIAESGWDKATLENERPFGMGFLSCLYSCGSFQIISNGQMIEGESKEILAGRPLEVKPAGTTKKLPVSESYTVINLYDFPLSVAAVQKAMRNLAYGFPLPVYFNDELLLAPQSIKGASEFIEVEGIGSIAIRPIVTLDNLKVNNSINVYLQGLPVYSRRYSYRMDYVCSENPLSNIVHLDPLKFTGRLPDWDKLIDEKASIEMIDAAINQIYLNKLLEFKATMDPKDFATIDMFRFAKDIAGGVDVFCAEDVRLPNYYIGKVSNDQPSCFSGTSRRAGSEKEYSYSFEDVSSGKVNICLIDDMETYETSNAAAWIFAKAIGWEIIEVDYMGMDNFKKHWVNQFVQKLGNENIKVEIINEVVGKRDSIVLDYWENACEIVLCEAYKLTYTHPTGVIHEIVIKNEPLLTVDNLLLVPHDCTDVSAAVLQGGDFEEDDSLLEDEYDKAGKALSLFVETLRTGDELSALESHLNTLWLSEYKKYAGNSYHMTLDQNCKIVLKRIEA